MPLIVMLILITIISTILEVANSIKHQTEIAEINRDIETKKEEILAETVQAGQSYTVPENGVYKIELNGGHGNEFGKKGPQVWTVSGFSGTKVII